MKKSFQTSNRFFWLLFAFIVSISIHSAFFISLKNISLDNYFYSHPSLIENQSLTADGMLTESRKKELAEKRSQELSTIFHALFIEPAPKDDHEPTDIESAPIDLAETVEEDLHLELPNEVLANESLRFELGTLPSPFEILPDPQEVLSDLEELQPVQADLQSSGEEFVQATKPLCGTIVSDIAEPEAEEDSLTIGGLETTPIQGNSFKEREGVLEEGFTDLEEGCDVVLMSVTETESLKNELLKRTKGLGKGLTYPLPSNLFLPYGLGSFIGITDAEEGNNDPFNYKVEYAVKNDMTGYFFRVTFMPKEANQFQKISQNYIFLVDRSRSIHPRRYEKTKNAVSNALDIIRKGDTFNIYMFDDRVAQFSDKPMPWNIKNVGKARQFLAEQKAARTFSSTDLHSSLIQILKEDLKREMSHVAILLSDGDTNLSKAKYRETIFNWTLQNHGNIALFSLPVGRGNNLPLLELLSAYNRGMLFHAASDEAVDDTLLTILLGIKNPIAKEIVVTAIFPETDKKDHPRKISIYPSQSRLPNLYENIPYVVYGSIDTLENFHLFLQGQSSNDIFTLKEFVDFSKADCVGCQEFERIWAIQQSYDLYDKFLMDNQKRHLQAIRKLLGPYKLTAAFQ